jgi:FMN-dependent NADH-azoreductase
MMNALAYAKKLNAQAMMNVAERYWEMEKYNFDSMMYENWEEFDTALEDSPFCSLIVFKFNGDKDKMNEYAIELWKENYPDKEITNLNSFPENITNFDDWVAEILDSQLEYEQEDFHETLQAAIKKDKIKRKDGKKHFIAHLKAHPLYDLITLQSRGDLTEIRVTMNELWGEF